jgi:hypothetical protein
MEGLVEDQCIIVRPDLCVVPESRFLYVTWSLALVSAVARSGRMVVGE